MHTKSTCTIDGCAGSLVGRGFCRRHYQRWWKYGDPHYVTPPPPPSGTCTIQACGRPVVARGWCSVHYSRWRVAGDPNATKLIVRNDPVRFWSKVEFTPQCWLWRGYTMPDGYGRFQARVDGSPAMVLVHRWAFEFCVGQIPDDLTIDHLCRTRNCVNPDHLEPVTHLENIMRSKAHD